MYLDKIKARFQELGFVRSEEVFGCTVEEIQVLERRLKLSLPGAYKEFLLWMGHGAGRLLQGSDCFYEKLPDIREWARELLMENNFTKALPEDAFVFFMHQGYQFNFLQVYEGEDPPVYFYEEGSDQNSFTIIYASFSEFLATEIEGHASLIEPAN